ncbi:tetratricopeptide repeat protein, partial [Streptomyces niveus]|uniref:tetratricopeptide repeat protein n=1 Tax=Streptomyces niveus TaxID=193462 RepID=UPI0033FCD5B6
MDFMGDRATLLETGRFVQGQAEDAAGAEKFGGATGATDAGGPTDSADAETEARHRRAADGGDVASMSVLGALLLRRGDLDAAEKYLRAATAEGDRAAANNLGVLLHQRGYTEEASGWWRVAAVAGSAAAAHALGRHYREQGDEPAAEYWLRQSAEQGHALGAYALADLLEHRSDVGSERWLRAAAEQGHREASYRLARALERRARQAARTGNTVRAVIAGRDGGTASGVRPVPAGVVDARPGDGLRGSPGAEADAGQSFLAEAAQWYRQAAEIEVDGVRSVPPPTGPPRHAVHVHVR